LCPRSKKHSSIKLPNFFKTCSCSLVNSQTNFDDVIFHFVVDCPLYENIRVKFFDKVIDLCPNFRYMDTSSKFVWLFTNEHEQVLKKLGSFIAECFLLRGHN
jgi:hypothetical protein